MGTAAHLKVSARLYHEIKDYIHVQLHCDFRDFKHWLLYPIVDLLACVKGIFQSQSQRTFMVCNHPNLLWINLSPGSV